MEGKDLYSVQNFVDVQKMNEQEQKWIDKMTNLVIDNIYNWNIEDNEEFRETYRNIWTAYNLMKQKFSEVIRDDWERYFEHLRAVTNIILEFIPEPNKEKVLIALLHDSIEDTNIDFHTLDILFWSKIAIAVVWLSKKDWVLYVSEKEILENYQNSNDFYKLVESDEEEILKSIWKERRNEEYFGHLELFDSMLNYVKTIIEEENIEWLTENEIIDITKNIIDVKLADRIHNLSTQWDENNLDKVKRKIDETKDYFLDIAKETNPIAYEKLKTLILDLEIKLANFSTKIDEIIN